MKEEPIFERIRKETLENDVVLYMRGSPMFPKCGYSAAILQILISMNVKFKTINALEDPSLYEGIQRFSGWPRIPQLYVKGDFLGGGETIREIYKTGELEKILKK